MAHSISFSEEIEKINDAFPVALYCVKCDRLRLMKIERGSDKLAHRCTACGTARRRRASRCDQESEPVQRRKPSIATSGPADIRMFVPKDFETAQGRELDVRATKTIAKARKMPLGQQRSDALEEAGRLRIAAEMNRWLSTK